MKRPLIIAILLVAALSWYGAFLATPSVGRPADFTVTPGESSDSIAQRLKQEGFIRSVWLFKLALRQSGLAARLQPGTYRFEGVGNFEEMISRLAAGGVAANEFVLRLIEGWDLRDVQKQLEASGYAAAGDFFAATGDPLAEPVRSDRRPSPDYSAQFPWLRSKPAGVSLEGYLFPDTYRFFIDAESGELVSALLENFGRRLGEAGLLDRAVPGGRSLHQVLTMASIVEKEVRTDEDRPLVADIFWRRLGIGMPLQADSTVNYVTEKKLAAVSAADLAVVSGYNTYKYPGLPPAPICNPGLKAIEAAFEPIPNDYWYFLTDSYGKVHYARTLEEHNRNKAKHLR